MTEERQRRKAIAPSPNLLPAANLLNLWRTGVRLQAMYRLLALLLICCFLAAPASAQKARECFSKAEETAEQNVREGLRLREGALGCDGQPWNAGTRALWEDIDRQFGPRFAAQTKVRERAFQREFADDADNRLGMWNGRIVMYFRNYPLSNLYCRDIRAMLLEMQKRGWGYFTVQAAKARDVVKMDYRPCDK